MAALGETEADEPGASGRDRRAVLPFARRDLDRLRLILAAQSRLREVHRSPRVKQMLAGRGYLEDALRWMEIHGGVQGQELAAHWRSLDWATSRRPRAALDPTPAAPARRDGGAAGVAPARTRAAHAATPPDPALPRLTDDQAASAPPPRGWEPRAGHPKQYRSQLQGAWPS